MNADDLFFDNREKSILLEENISFQSAESVCAFVVVDVYEIYLLIIGISFVKNQCSHKSVYTDC
jgi:hypothetical protein